jgi:hypothetical protein
VVFRGDTGGADGIYKGGGGPATTVVDSHNPNFNQVATFGNAPQMNDNGSVVFFGQSSAKDWGGLHFHQRHDCPRGRR